MRVARERRRIHSVEFLFFIGLGNLSRDSISCDEVLSRRKSREARLATPLPNSPGAVRHVDKLPPGGQARGKVFPTKKIKTMPKFSAVQISGLETVLQSLSRAPVTRELHGWCVCVVADHSFATCSMDNTPFRRCQRGRAVYTVRA